MYKQTINSFEDWAKEKRPRGIIAFENELHLQAMAVALGIDISKFSPNGIWTSTRFNISSTEYYIISNSGLSYRWAICTIIGKDFAPEFIEYFANKVKTYAAKKAKRDKITKLKGLPVKVMVQNIFGDVTLTKKGEEHSFWYKTFYIKCKVCEENVEHMKNLKAIIDAGFDIKKM